MTQIIEWVSFDDTDGDRWLFDATFLTSRWTCIFGAGCEGIVEDPAVGRLQGCCSNGAHVGDDEDRRIVEAAIGRLPQDLWQNAAEAPTIADAFRTDDEGATLTAMHNNACVFLNGPDFHTGAGCAFHFAAERLGGTHPEWKPEACWQLPIRLEHTTEGGDDGRTVYMLRRWERADWGEAGEDFAWWCTDTEDALRSDDQVYRSLETELRSLLGDGIYDAMAGALATRPPLQTNSVAVQIDLRPR